MRENLIWGLKTQTTCISDQSTTTTSPPVIRRRACDNNKRWDVYDTTTTKKGYTEKDEQTKSPRTFFSSDHLSIAPCVRWIIWPERRAQPKTLLQEFFSLAVVRPHPAAIQRCSTVRTVLRLLVVVVPYTSTSRPWRAPRSTIGCRCATLRAGRVLVFQWQWHKRPSL